MVHQGKPNFSRIDITGFLHTDFWQILQQLHQEIGIGQRRAEGDARLVPHKSAFLQLHLLRHWDKADILGREQQNSESQEQKGDKGAVYFHGGELIKYYLAVSRYEISAAAFSTTAITANTMNCVRMLSTVLPFKITVFMADMKNDIGLA